MRTVQKGAAPLGRWDKHREWLEDARSNLLSRLEQSGHFGLDDPLADQLGELSTYDNHPADIASEVFEREKDLGLLDATHLRLQDIERAIGAIDEGTYGTCDMCGKPIPEERLDAYPLTTVCVDCKRKDEATHPDRNRPIEEEFLYPGFGRTDTDHSDHISFDGEDSWQAVERYNIRSGYRHMYEESTFDEDNGLVDDVDNISNEQYRDQLP